MAATDGYALDRELPAEVQTAHGAGWDRYRQYPVFSLRWLYGRTALFAAVIAPIAALIGLGTGLVTRDAGVGARVALIELLAFTAMAATGPAFATWVRHRRWPPRLERKAVVVAVLLGMLASGVVDWTASSYLEGLVRRGEPTAVVEPSLGAASGALALVAHLVFLAFVYGLFGGGLALRAYFSEHRRWQAWQRERDVREARLQARDADLRLGVLQAQVEPHFLFNTLASIRALIRRDPERAERTLDALVAHLRATIPRMRGYELQLHSTLAQQLDICAGYLEVVRLRTDGRLSCSIEADGELRALPYPPSLLITLVENAVKHGVEPRPGAGRIEVRVVREGDVLVARVADDGAGLSPGIGSGTGLSNVRAQLRARYGPRASLRLCGREGGGTLAEIRTPLEAEAR